MAVPVVQESATRGDNGQSVTITDHLIFAPDAWVGATRDRFIFAPDAWVVGPVDGDEWQTVEGVPIGGHESKGYGPLETFEGAIGASVTQS